MSDKIVPASGPPNAKIYIVGEAPGETELWQGRPFVGPSGNLLWSVLLESGITRNECRVNNVIQHKLPKNKWADATEIEIQCGLTQLLADIKSTKPNVVLALGGAVLWCLTGKSGIDNWRGSVLWSELAACKILPTYHPAYLLRDTKATPLFVFDLGKLRLVASTPTHTEPETKIKIAPTFEEASSAMERYSKSDLLAFDIETFPNLETRLNESRCIAFADNPIESICVPMTKGYWGDKHERILEEIKQTLESPVPKTGQNGQFDIAVLAASHQIRVSNYALDTMCAQHVAYPELPKSLSTLCSIYTNRPYYKFMRGTESDEVLWNYNALDAVVTYEAAQSLEKELRELGVYDFYTRVVHPLIPLMVEMQSRGCRIDMPKLHMLRMQERLAFAQALLGLWESIGWPVNPRSFDDLKEVLYNELHFTPVVKHGKQTVDKLAIAKLAAKYKHPIFDLLLRARRAGKQEGTYLLPSLVREGRMHTSYNIGGTIEDQSTGKAKSAPETGRLSSSYSIVYFSGMNLQNITRGYTRSMFLPDENQILVEADLSQAEARVVAYDADEPTMIRLFETGGDIHKWNAAWIYSVPLDKVSKDQRQFAKTHVHAFNYGEGPKMFADRAGITLAEGRRIQDGYYQTYPAIRLWHSKIQTCLRNGLPQWGCGRRTLCNLLGRKRIFFGRLDESCFRSAYSYRPQSTIGDLLNIILVNTDKEVKRLGLTTRPILQVHDSMVFTCPESELSALCNVVEVCSKIELKTGPYKFTIPIEIKIGRNWGNMKPYISGKTVEEMLK